MSIKGKELEENLHEEQAESAGQRQEDPYGFENYFEVQLSPEINQFGEISERGKEALKKLYDGRMEAEKMWLDSEIETQDRIRMKSDIAREVGEEYSDLFSEDAAFAEGISIIVDQTG